MMKQNRFKLILSSILILLPSAVALIIKDCFVKSMRGAWYFTWIMPIVLLCVHLLCIFFSINDNKQNSQNKKIINITFFVVPAISAYVSAIFIALGLGLDVDIGIIVSVFLGAMFIVMGNYAPKAVRNRTFGIKIKWTLVNDDNWIATHRFVAKLWVGVGIAILALVFIPLKFAIIGTVILLFVAVIPPLIYSYLFYKRQIRNGEATEEDYRYKRSARDKKISVIALVISGIVIVLVAVLMFFGRINIECTDDALVVKPTFGGGVTVKYSELSPEMIEYREEKIEGSRVSGYASAKLLYGWFRNDEFGDYTRYTYTKCKAAIIIRMDDEVLVIADETPELTYALYEELLSKIN